MKYKHIYFVIIKSIIFTYKELKQFNFRYCFIIIYIFVFIIVDSIELKTFFKQINVCKLDDGATNILEDIIDILQEQF